VTRSTYKQPLRLGPVCAMSLESCTPPFHSLPSRTDNPHPFLPPRYRTLHLPEGVPQDLPHRRRKRTPPVLGCLGGMCLLAYYLSKWGNRSNYAMIIDVAKLLSAIPTDVRSVPWVDWGPSSTHLFEIRRTTMPIPAGPYWITHLSPLVVRDYSVLRIRYTQLTAGDGPSSYSHQLVNTSTEAYNEYLEAYKIETHLPYRNIVANHLDFGRFKSFIADREWIVGITTTVRLCQHTRTI
jgi:hypothetical protein